MKWTENTKLSVVAVTGGTRVVAAESDIYMFGMGIACMRLCMRGKAIA